MNTPSYEAGQSTGYYIASETDWDSNPDIFTDVVVHKVKENIKQITFFVEIHWGEFWLGVDAGIRNCFNDAVYNGANADMTKVVIK